MFRVSRTYRLYCDWKVEHFLCTGPLRSVPRRSCWISRLGGGGGFKVSTVGGISGINFMNCPNTQQQAAAGTRIYKHLVIISLYSTGIYRYLLESNFSNLKFEYLRENELLSKTILAFLSGAQVGWIFRKKCQKIL